MRFIGGLAELAQGYDGFIVDLWGVIHDGLAPYPGALECLERLRPKPVLLLSNAPRRAGAVQATLRGLGISRALYTAILTSGEATWQALADRADPFFAAVGGKVYHIGPARDRGVIDPDRLRLVASPVEADFLLNTGPDDQRDGQALEAFTAELDACLAAGLAMICANPDLEIVRGGQRILCAGALASYYEARGGLVRWIGKPYPEIYRRALSTLNMPPGRVLAIGDSLRTDIAGARNAGLDSAWVLGGLHADELGSDRTAIIAAARDAGLSPVAVLPRFAW